jgi:prevent-host-death family protein
MLCDEISSYLRIPDLQHMTIYGYYMVMKQTGVAELKARLSEYLRAVRRGESVTILDRATPIAKMVPIPNSGLRIRKPAEGAPSPNRVPLLPPLKLKFDVLELLLEERQGQR